MEQQQFNKDPPNANLKEKVQQILQQKVGNDDDLLDPDRNIQNRSQRSSTAIQKGGRKKTNSIDQGLLSSFREIHNNSASNPVKATSIPLSQIMQNIEQQNQMNQLEQDSKAISRESISLSEQQMTEISNSLKTLVSNARNIKNNKEDKDQQHDKQSSKELLKLQKDLSIQKYKFQNSKIDIKPNGKQVVSIIKEFCQIKQLGNLDLAAEDYKKLTLICIQCNLREWTDFLLEDMQNNDIEPDRFILDDYIRFVADS